MKIGMLSKADAAGGGASRVAEELTELLVENGHEVRQYVAWSSRGYSAQRQPVNGKANLTIRIANYALKKAGFPEVVPWELPFLLSRLKHEKFDLLHFHDISSAFSPLTLLYLSKRVPVVWTIHDCSPFTAGCLYPMACDRYTRNCGRCPQIGQWPLDCYIDNTRCLLRIKKYVHKKRSLLLMSPSEWMSNMAFSSGTVAKKPNVVPNCVDTQIFKPVNKQTARQVLGLDPERFYIMLSAGNILDDRKGALYAIRALEPLKHMKPFLLLAGNIQESQSGFFRAFDHRMCGYVSDRRLLNIIYAAADIFLFCSLADNQPLAVLESMSAGTPVIGFLTGGLPEMIINNETGMLVPPKDVRALSSALETALLTKRYQQWGLQARHSVETTYSKQAFYRNHHALYQELIQERFAYGLK